MPHPRIDPAQGLREGPVLPKGYVRDAASPPIYFPYNRNTRPRVFDMARPRVAGIGVDPVGNLVQGRGICAFLAIGLMQARWDLRRLERVNRRSTKHGVCTIPDVMEVSREPILRHASVCIGAKQRHPPRRQTICMHHSQAPRSTCRPLGLCELVLDHCNR